MANKICPMIFWSTYDLLSSLYSDGVRIRWVKECKNAGGSGFRYFAMIDGADKYGPTWKFSPWDEGLNGWDERWWDRFQQLNEQAWAYGLKAIITIYLSQPTPLDRIENGMPQNIYEEALKIFASGDFTTAWERIRPFKGRVLDYLKRFIDEIKKREVDFWHNFELINECGDWKLIMIPELSRHLRERFPKAKIIHSGEAPTLLSPYYDYYSPHTWGGSKLLKSLSENKFSDPEEISYLKGLQSLGKTILPSSDGCMPDLYNDAQKEEIIQALIERSYKGWEVDLGWFTKGTEKIENVEWELAYDFTEKMESLLGVKVGGYLSLYCHPYKKPRCEDDGELKCRYGLKEKRWKWECVAPKKETPSDPCKKKLSKMNLGDIFACLLSKIMKLLRLAG